MTRLSDAFSLMPNPADSYGLDFPPTRKELDEFCHRLMEEMIVCARFRYNSTEFKDVAPIDEDTLRDGLKDTLSDATQKAWRELR